MDKQETVLDRRIATRNRFVFGPGPKLFSGFEELAQPPRPQMRDAILTFQANLRSTFAVASPPFRMVHNKVYSGRFQALHAAERIRRLSPAEPSGLTEEQEQQALASARQESLAFLSSGEGTNWFRDHVLDDLGVVLADLDLASAADELLRQTLASLWGSFEVFIGDVLIDLFDSKPALAYLALSKDPARRHFPERTFPTELLMKHDFNMSEVMGTTLFGERKPASLPMIRDILSVIFPKVTAVHDDAFWTLWQRRHIIVHQRGIVDKAYAARTGEQRKIGEHLVLRGEDIDAAATIVQEAVFQVARQLS